MKHCSQIFYFIIYRVCDIIIGIKYNRKGQNFMAQKGKKTNGKSTTVILVCVILAVVCLCLGVWKISDAKIASDKASGGSQTESVAENNLDTSLTYYADISIKDYGTVTVKLEPSEAPVTCENFINLANSGFYNGLTFHRIMEGFMMQGGNPKGDGTGGSDQTIIGEFSDNGYKNTLSHKRGAISMARNGYDYNSASSQFFIVQADSTFLDGQYAAFGYVTSGIEIVDKICKNAKPTDDNGTIPASQQPVIESVSIKTE